MKRREVIDRTTIPDNECIELAREALIAGALRPGGVVVIWSANPDRQFERRVRRAGLSCETRKVYARGAVRKGGRHYLFVARARR